MVVDDALLLLKVIGAEQDVADTPTEGLHPGPQLQVDFVHLEQLPEELTQKGCAHQGADWFLITIRHKIGLCVVSLFIRNEQQEGVLLQWTYMQTSY